MDSAAGSSSSVVSAVKRSRSTKSRGPNSVKPKGGRTAKGLPSDLAFGGPVPYSALFMNAFDCMFKTRALSHMLSAVDLRNLSMVARPFRAFQIWRLTKWTETAREAVMRGSLPQLTELFIAKYGCSKPLAPALTKLKFLYTLRLAHPRLEAKDIRAIGKVLQELSQLTTLVLNSVDFKWHTDALEVFMQGLAHTKSLRRLLLAESENKPWRSQAGLQALGKALSTLPLESLSVDCSVHLLPIITSALPHVAATLLELDVLNYGSRHDTEWKQFLQALPAASCLKVLRVTRQRREKESVLWGQALSAMSKLEILILKFDIHTEWDAHFASSIANLRDLRELTIGMRIRGNGAAALIGAVENAHALEVLDLRDCLVHHDIDETLRAGLGGVKCPRLKHLYLPDEEIRFLAYWYDSPMKPWELKQIFLQRFYRTTSV